MAKLELFYTFNENSATTIRDYSSNGLGGTGLGATIQASAGVGYELVFNSIFEVVSFDASGFDNPVNLGVSFTFTPEATVGTLQVLSCGTLDVTWDGTTIVAAVSDEAAGTSTVSWPLTSGTKYRIVLVKDGSSVWRIYVDSALKDQDSGFSSGSADLGATFYIGNNGGTGAANFQLQELKIFTTLLDANNIDAIYNNDNGVYMSNSVPHNYILGDIIGNTINTEYAVVTFIENNKVFKIQPLTTGIIIGLPMHKLGHAWDDTKDHYLTLDEDGIYYYDSVNSVAEVLNSDNLKWKLTEVGLTDLNYISKDANYTLLTTDKTILCDTNTIGAFTVTLPVTPTDGLEYIIKDALNSFSAAALTINPNGKTIDTISGNMLLTRSKSVLKLKYFTAYEWLIMT